MGECQMYFSILNIVAVFRVEFLLTLCVWLASKLWRDKGMIHVQLGPVVSLHLGFRPVCNSVGRTLFSSLC